MLAEKGVSVKGNAQKCPEINWFFVRKVVKRFMRFSLKPLKYPALLLALTLWYCRSAVFGGMVLFPMGGDHVHSIYGSMAFFRESILLGSFPLWNPLNLCGHPFGVTSITTLNLYHLSSIFLEAGSAYNTVTIASIFFGGLFLYFFVTRNGISPFAAWISMAAWMITTSKRRYPVS